ncbi:MAG: hypothetical protein BWY82_00542 [Verrucomicrobia bacterium ADurb.Bin474]|nr:MAG: hypothetical protein BWY82_00542 [Verrucomicrobia bacterium ADurb.Bin474]
MTAPLLNATTKAAFNDSCAAAAARLDAYVAVRIPKYPARAEKKPPVTKAKGTHGFCTRSP